MISIYDVQNTVIRFSNVRATLTCKIIFIECCNTYTYSYQFSFSSSFYCRFILYPCHLTGPNPKTLCAGTLFFWVRFTGIRKILDLKEKKKKSQAPCLCIWHSLLNWKPVLYYVSVSCHWMYTSETILYASYF